MRLCDYAHAIHDRRNNGESYYRIGASYGIKQGMVWQIEHGYKPGKRVSAILNLDPEPDLKYTRTRREHLDAIARRWGFEGWSNYETMTIRHDELLKL